MEKRYLLRESRSEFHCTDQSCNRPYEPTLILEEFNLLKKDQLNSWVYCWTFNGFIILFLAFVFNNEVKQSEQSEQSLFCQTKRWENSITGVKRSFSCVSGIFPSSAIILSTPQTVSLFLQGGGRSAVRWLFSSSSITPVFSVISASSWHAT